MLKYPLTYRLSALSRRYRFRSAVTGRYVSRLVALLRPNEPVRELA